MSISQLTPGTWENGLTCVPCPSNGCSALGVTCFHNESDSCQDHGCVLVIWLDLKGYQQWAVNRLTSSVARTRQ